MLLSRNLLCETQFQGEWHSSDVEPPLPPQVGQVRGQPTLRQGDLRPVQEAPRDRRQPTQRGRHRRPPHREEVPAQARPRQDEESVSKEIGKAFYTTHINAPFVAANTETASMPSGTSTWIPSCS